MTRRVWLETLAVFMLVTLGTREFIYPPLVHGTDNYDVVILNGRVMDPESGLDAVRNVGVMHGRIATVSWEPLQGETTLDAKGLVVAPGFIDLHSHGQDPENYKLKAMDGVTTALELEIGVADVAGWYAQREGRALINFGASSGHVPARMRVMHDPGKFLPVADAVNHQASPVEIEDMKRLVEQGLQQGGLGVGFGIQYVPQASRWEILEMFRVAARYGGPAFVHLRWAGTKEPASATAALEEVIAAALVTGTPLHVVHISSTGMRAVPELLATIGEARAHGLDVTTECYPYTAGMTDLSSAIFAPGWQEILGIGYHELQWAATGERLTAESFARYRKAGGMVAIHSIPEDIVRLSVASPLTLIASDGIMEKGKGHPRAAGTYARVLGRYVREEQALTLMQALRKMTVMPAHRLEHIAPVMKNKGRVRVGADADLAVFDPERIIDKATYDQPSQYSLGFEYVLVNGVLVVKGGKLVDGVAPGRGIRAERPSVAVTTTTRRRS